MPVLAKFVEAEIDNNGSLDFFGTLSEDDVKQLNRRSYDDAVLKASQYAEFADLELASPIKIVRASGYRETETSKSFNYEAYSLVNNIVPLPSPKLTFSNSVDVRFELKQRDRDE